MSLIIVVRDPNTGHLSPIVKDDSRIIQEFDTKNDAIYWANSSTLCRAWEYEFIEVSI